jgi:NAD(P)-dependent dehydrogenase (short-subunit alcohol dehydrogenase family)
LVIALAVYALVPSIRKKGAKPNYNNKLIWITGTSSGIGEYLADEFNDNESSLVLAARSTKELKRVQEACPQADKSVNLQIGHDRLPPRLEVNSRDPD